MIKQKTTTFILYSSVFLFILGWWCAAFKITSNNPQEAVELKSDNRETKIFATLAPVDRKVLQKALQGNIPLMTRLIADWDIDAQLLQLAGHIDVRRLNPQEYLRSQVLGRQITYSFASHPTPRLLPQTYVSASYLLALAHPKQIVALPSGLRQHTSLFPSSLTDKIPDDIDQYNSETLYLAQPEIAFIAPYSHPCLINVLKKQGTKLVTLSGSNSIEDIQAEIREIGTAINQPFKAEMLSIFMEAAMHAIDNRLLLVKKELLAHPSMQILFVNYHSHYSLPTLKTLTGELLKRMGVISCFANKLADNDEKWMIPLNREQIAKINPGYLIIATNRPEMLKSEIIKDPALSELEAIKCNRVYFVDECIQQFPSQYLVLAYYDIANVLLNADFL